MALRVTLDLYASECGQIQCYTKSHTLIVLLSLAYPYVARMARKQNGGYDASISVQTPLVHLVANCTHPKTVRSAL